MISAGGAFGTPELLLRSGIRHPALGRHLHIHPAAWIGARYEEEVRGWEGVMQSYYVDQWQPEGILLEATFTPLSFGAQWLPGAGAAFTDRVANFDHIASIGVHLHDHSEGRVGLSSNGSLRLSYRLLGGGGAANPVRDRQGGGDPLRGRRDRGLSERRPGLGDQARASSRSSSRSACRPADLRLEAFHPMSTARMGADADTERRATRRRRARRRGPLRRRREPAADLGRRQPDDDRHRLRHPRGARTSARVAKRLRAVSEPAAASCMPR